MKKLIDKLYKTQTLAPQELELLIKNINDEELQYLHSKAREVANNVYGNRVFVRGLIEFTNICKNNCYYCGIRAENKSVSRYRLTKEEILECCENGYAFGFRTFVLQGGEDLYFDDDKMVDIISTIRNKYPDCAITLSIGEKSIDAYQKYFDAGAERYLLRHETADSEHYSKLHPENLTLENRIECLKSLKQIGFQTGCGFMVGSPYQTTKTIVKDLMFIKEFEPEMVGIGPFLPHNDTPFKDFAAGSVRLTLMLLSIVRLMLPDVLLPATTALNTAESGGRENGILAGANVIMPNLSPESAKEKYILYNGKVSTGAESAEQIEKLKQDINKIGYNIVCDRGDNKRFVKEKNYV